MEGRTETDARKAAAGGQRPETGNAVVRTALNLVALGLGARTAQPSYETVDAYWRTWQQLQEAATPPIRKPEAAQVRPKSPSKNRLVPTPQPRR
jgi:hypothetical protein